MNNRLVNYRSEFSRLFSNPKNKNSIFCVVHFNKQTTTSQLIRRVRQLVEATTLRNGILDPRWLHQIEHATDASQLVPGFPAANALGVFSQRIDQDVTDLLVHFVHHSRAVDAEIQREDFQLSRDDGAERIGDLLPDIHVDDASSKDAVFERSTENLEFHFRNFVVIQRGGIDL